jgi:hypothetical protein
MADAADSKSETRGFGKPAKSTKAQCLSMDAEFQSYRIVSSYFVFFSPIRHRYTHNFRH